MTNETITTIVEKLKEGIKIGKEYGNNPDEVSWGYQEGILVTMNEAQSLVDFIEGKEEYKSAKEMNLTMDSPPKDLVQSAIYDLQKMRSRVAGLGSIIFKLNNAIENLELPPPPQAKEEK